VMKGDKKTRIGTAAFVILFNGVLVQTMRTAYRDAQNDEDDKLLDPENWNPSRFTIGILTDPLYGFPIFGQIAQDLIMELAGQKAFKGNVLDMIPDAGKSMRRMITPNEYIEDGELDKFFSDFQKISTLGAVVSKRSAASAVVMNILTQAAKLLKNLTN